MTSTYRLRSIVRKSLRLLAMVMGWIEARYGAVVGQALDGTIVPMTTAMGLAGILCLLSNRLLVPRQ